MSGARRRRPISVVGGLLILLNTVACGGLPAPAAPTESAPSPPATLPPPALSPPAPQPVAEGPCPYLSAAAVQAANGQRVAAVWVSDTSPAQPHPACFFLTGNGTVQLRTWIVVATPAVARATVDAAAPVATSDVAELPGGWSGGLQPTAAGAVFAVSRQGTAVVVTTNQRQTISARRVAEQVISTLGR
jgi:UPF0176 protein